MFFGNASVFCFGCSGAFGLCSWWGLSVYFLLWDGLDVGEKRKEEKRREGKRRGADSREEKRRNEKRREQKNRGDEESGKEKRRKELRRGG